MKRTVKVEILLPMEFRDDMDDEAINFYLNDSSWCASNIIELLEEYDENIGCLCNICQFEVLPNGNGENQPDL